MIRVTSSSLGRTTEEGILVKKLIMGAAVVGSVGLLAQPAAALHNGATANCGTAGTFTIQATPNGAGFESPPFGDALLFEEGGRLSIFVISIDGRVTFDAAEVGMANNHLEEVTCSFTLANGVHVEVTGILAGRR
jgi:hypothetical protein